MLQLETTKNLLGDKCHPAFAYFHLEYNFEVEVIYHVTDRHIGHVVGHHLDMNMDHFDHIDHSVDYLSLKSKMIMSTKNMKINKKYHRL